MNREFTDLTASEVLALAISIEAHNAGRYHDWSMRFKTYDSTISELLADLAKEEEMHRSYLTGFYHARYGDDVPHMDPEMVRAGKDIPGIPEDHFFVDNTTTARAIIEAAVSVEVRAHRFYERLIASCDDPELCELYQKLLEFEAGHVAVMEERLSRCKSG
jgi:erythrin-vacuolar iron transport family protein